MKWTSPWVCATDIGATRSRNNSQFLFFFTRKCPCRWCQISHVTVYWVIGTKAPCPRYRVNKTCLAWRHATHHNGRDSVSNHQPHDCFSTVNSDADQRKHQSTASLALVRGTRRGPVNSTHKWPVTRKKFPFHDVIMILVYRSALVESHIYKQTSWLYELDISVLKIIVLTIFFPTWLSLAANITGN